jgi:hypothetical protein
MILNRIYGVKMWLKYWRCRFWYRHKFERMEFYDDGKLMGYDDTWVGCRQCDLWRMV